MNKANLKRYAPKARLDFIKAVTERANVLGISAAGVVPAEVRGDVALIDGREWPVKVAGQRDELIARIKRHGFEQTMDEVAYTWFNRFAALRYMEIHDYLGHGWRVLSSRDGGLPEILRHASEVTLPGLNPDRAREMQLAGNQDNELYKLLLVAQCNELSRVMPFLFERIDDETELLLPENLLRTDSIVAKLVEQVPEEDWQEIEVIGWLYQFYISEKKDQVIGKVVKSEDIPAATQLFTPNWIVQYLVQNSVGRLWLMANPTSTLASQWPYYIQPAEQSPEVQAQLNALIQTRIREDGETLNPETITVLDPACGSGHILVVAYDVLKAIYLERGYQPRSIPRLILEKNLYGLDIDDRAAQLAAFALLMRARADDRRLFTDPPKLNVQSLQETKGLNADELTSSLAPFGLQFASLKTLLDTFIHAKTVGSLIQIPAGLSAQLASMAAGLRQALQDGDLYARQAAKDVVRLAWQALVLSMRFDSVVANPPYMGTKGMNETLRGYAKASFSDSKSDLFSMFIERAFRACRPTGMAGMVTMQTWMFLSTYEDFRKALLQNQTITTLAQIGYNSFPELNSKIAQAVAFLAFATAIQRHTGVYFNLNSSSQSANKGELFLSSRHQLLHQVKHEHFAIVPGAPLAYWMSEQFRQAFQYGTPLKDVVAAIGKGMDTGDNALFLRYWFEVSSASRRWKPYLKGGPFRKWYGNTDYVVDWAEDGEHLKSHEKSNIRNASNYFKPGITWSKITSSSPSFRAFDEGFIWDTTGPCISVAGTQRLELLAYLNSRVSLEALRFIAPALDFQSGNVAALPILPFKSQLHRDAARRNSEDCITTSKIDWDSLEVSRDFSQVDLLTGKSVSLAWAERKVNTDMRYARMRKAEESNNEIFIDTFNLHGECSAEVLDDQITLTRADRKKDSIRIISYAIGCLMGRYSLECPGLIYAIGGNANFDISRYGSRFPPDRDGIVPLTDEHWFEDDAASRLSDFMRAVWGPETFDENMAWLAESLGSNGGQTANETIRSYLAYEFFEAHLQAYKKRPIYWLFCSGKQGAFQALVYLHRYNAGTLARMRAEYVVPLIAMMASRLEMLSHDVAAASSAAARTRLQKQIEALRKKQVELLAYDEKLRHYADMQITLDLDDGVKVNYAKFGDLVAGSKAICGGKDED